MPLVYQQNINPDTRLGIWHIAEAEDFFVQQQVPLQRTITHPHKRLQHLAGRMLLKELFPAFPFELIRIADTRKPFIENELYHFSISHCGDYAAALVSTRQRVGVDVEIIKDKAAKIKHKFLSEREQQMIDTSPSSGNVDYDCRITTAWSIKESLYKWYGDGEVDFIDHLPIDAMDWTDNSGIAHCRVLKDSPISLQVQFLLFNNNCVSWVLSEA